MAYTEEQLRTRIATLEDGLMLVEKGVQFADRGVTYNNAHELIQRIDYFKKLLSQVVGGRSRQTLMHSSKGFGC